MFGKNLMLTEPMAELWREENELFNPLAVIPSPIWGGPPELFGKSMELKVEDGKHELQLSLKTPGYEKKHLKVSVKNGVLSISGERKAENRTKTGNCNSYSSSYGSFTRSVTLPETVNAKKAKVEVKNGEMKITLPKKSGK